MSIGKGVTPVPKAMFWTGCVLSAVPVLMLLMSAAMKFLKPPEIVKSMADMGVAEHLAFPLGIVEIVCTVLYVIPQTSVLGAILLTGYLGGATATHVRVGDNFAIPIVIGIVIWLGLLLRDRRLWDLLPLRR